MSRRFQMATGLLAVAAMCLLCDVANAQGGRGGGRGGFGFGRGGFGRATSQIQLATLSEVQDDLGLSEEQITAVADLNDEYAEARREARGGRGGGGGGGGRGFGQLTDEQRAAQEEMDAEYLAKLDAILEDEQSQRLLGIFAQVNGTTALTDPAVVAALELSDDTVAELREVAAEQQQEMMESFQDMGFGEMTPEERTEALAKLTAERDEAVLAVLSDDQKGAWNDLKGEALEVDLAPLRGGRGGGFGGGRGGRGGA